MFCFAMMPMSDKGMDFYKWYLRSLQIIIHLPMLRIVVPGNVSEFFRYIIPIVQFDILDAEWTTELIMEFDYEGHERIGADILD